MKIFLLTLLLSKGLFAQTNETIRSGRPGQIAGAYVVGTGLLQLQSGVDYRRPEKSSALGQKGMSNVLRFGLSERFELSTLFNFRQEDNEGKDRDGISDLHLGFRYNLISKPAGLRPGLGIQARARTTAVASVYRPDHVAPIMILATNHLLGSELALNHNFGMNYDGFSPDPIFSVVSQLTFPVLPKLRGMVEVYGNEREGIWRRFIDTGLAYFVSNDLQLDGLMGYGDNQGRREIFAGIGVSFRMQAFKSHR